MPKVRHGMRSTHRTHPPKAEVPAREVRSGVGSTIPLASARLYPHIADDADGTDPPRTIVGDQSSRSSEATPGLLEEPIEGIGLWARRFAPFGGTEGGTWARG
jgi:hypothetical protein